MNFRRGPIALAAALAMTATLLAPLGAAAASPSPSEAGRQELRQAAGGDVRMSDHAVTGRLRFVGTEPGQPVRRPAGVAATDPADVAARGFLAKYGALFGEADQQRDLQVTRVTDRASNARGGAVGANVRFQQVRDGVPVLAGDLTVQLDRSNRVVSAAGELLPDAEDIDTTATFTEGDARTLALEVVAKHRETRTTDLQATDLGRWIHKPGLLHASHDGPTRLAWRFEVTASPASSSPAMRELVLIDARNGASLLHFDQLADAKNRYVCDNNRNTSLPENCDIVGPYMVRDESDGPSGVSDVDNVFDFTGDTYDYYFDNLGRDSLDDAGMALLSTVRYCPSAQDCPYANAYWNGAQMVYGEGVSTDDVVGHELTHGVTEHESNLFYYYQSGAINESMSDVFGELIDISNGSADDNATTRWQIGEGSSLGVIRDMEDPAGLGDPDRMQSPNYYSPATNYYDSAGDSGGVHSNSGVNNKAAYLMTDGGTFNGQTITGLDAAKTAHIYYEVNTTLLTSGSDYADLGDALVQACDNLVGSFSIATPDCDEVAKVVAATEMGLQPVTGAGSAPVAACDQDGTPADLFVDDFESPGTPTWTFSTPPTGLEPWTYTTGYAHSGTIALYGFNNASASDTRATSPAIALPTGADSLHLRFEHAYDFEASGSTYYDGGVLEYSTDGGSSWTDAGSLITDHGYTGTITVGAAHGPNASENPLKGQQAFTNVSSGYITTRLDLASLAGETVKFRWRIGTDQLVYALGWLVDDVHVYTCTAADPVLVGAGDISTCSNDNDEATAVLLDDIFANDRPGKVFTAGDNVYDTGTATEFANCYDPTWGRHLDRTRPSPGNHDYGTTDAAGYYDYFGARAGDPTKGYYSYDLGDWHVVALNSNCAEVGGCEVGSPQYDWLVADLAASGAQCTAAYWHHPRFSSSSTHGSSTSVQALYDALYEGGADVAITGHDHTYERFAPQDADGNLDTTYGVRQFVAGTGGRSHYGFGTPLANSQVRDSTSYGVLKLTLHASSFDWEFVPIDGDSFTDSGTQDCHDAPDTAPQDIVFSSNRDGDYEIYSMHADGSHVLKLTDNDVDDRDPKWSHDGTKIAFTSQRDGNEEIYVMDADGSNPTNVTNDASSDTRPRWAPDGNRIAFISTRDGTSADVWILDVTTGTAYRQLTDGFWASDPVFSPDGHWVYFARIEAAESDIWRVRADGTGTQEQVTSSEGTEVPTDISSDGSTIAYMTDGAGTGIDLMKLSLAGGSPVPLATTAADEITATWSPDDAQLVFARDTDGDHEISVMDADGTNVSALTFNSATDWEPDWRSSGACLDDSREDDDTSGTANDLGTGGQVTDGVLCPGDEDWFSIDAAAGETIVVTLTQDRHAGDVVLELYDDEGTLLDTTEGGTTDDESVSLGVTLGGTYTVRVVGSVGVVNSYLLVADALVLSRFEQTDGAFEFGSGWILSTYGGYSGGSARYTATSAASVSVLFSGPVVRLVGSVGPDRGIAEVFIDGESQGTIDTYAPTSKHRQVVFDAAGLGDGVHTLEVVHTGTANPSATNSYVIVDAIDAVAVVALSRFEQTDGAFEFGSGWILSTYGGYSGGSARYTATSAASVSVLFSGPVVRLVGSVGPDRGIAEVFIDGESQGTIDTYAPTSKHRQVVFAVSGLGDGVHTLEVVHTGTANPSATNSYVIVDAIDAVAVVALSRFEQTDGAFEFGSGWILSTYGGYSGGSARYTATSAASVSVLFSGPVVRLVGSVGPDRGIAEVFIDGESQGTIDTYAPTSKHRQVVFDAAGLGDGVHTLEVVHTGTANPSATNSYVIVDAIDAVAVVALSRFEQTDGAFEFGSGWILSTYGGYSGGSARYTATSAASVSVLFSGPVVRLVGSVGPDRGIAEVFIDGESQGTIDTYAPTSKHRQVVFAVSGLGDGVHTLEVVHTGTANPSATNSYVIVDAIHAVEMGLS